MKKLIIIIASSILLITAIITIVLLTIKKQDNRIEVMVKSYDGAVTFSLGKDFKIDSVKKNSPSFKEDDTGFIYYGEDSKRIYTDYIKKLDSIVKIDKTNDYSESLFFIYEGYMFGAGYNEELNSFGLICFYTDSEYKYVPGYIAIDPNYFGNNEESQNEENRRKKLENDSEGFEEYQDYTFDYVFEYNNRYNRDYIYYNPIFNVNDKESFINFYKQFGENVAEYNEETDTLYILTYDYMYDLGPNPTKCARLQFTENGYRYSRKFIRG